MKRRPLLELHDRDWFPSFLRNDFVETLSAVLRLVRAYHGLAGPFGDWLKAARGSEVLDLASGGGGPVETLVRGLKRAQVAPPRFVLSDLYPDTARFAEMEAVYPDLVTSCKVPVDATRVESEQKSLRSMISSFHHFEPAQARSILEDAVENSSGIFVAEPFQRSFRHLLLSPLSVFPVLASPFLDRKLDPLKIFFTFILPVLPLVMVVDTFLSVLRCYSEEEIRELIDSVSPNRFAWRIGSITFMGVFRTTFFFGWKEEPQ